MNVDIDNLADTIAEAVKTYTDDITDGIEKAVDETATTILSEVKSAARKRTGKYAAGFAKNNQCTPGNRRYVVWNKKYFYRVHLLEKGHAKRGGGRVRAFPHMEPAERKNCTALEEKVKQIIKNGG